MNPNFTPYETLQEFSGIPITHREADVIACILNGRTSKKSIADFLGIEARTAETHVRNLMKKLRCSSWEKIRDTFGNSNAATPYREHFQYLTHEKNFITLLKKLLIKNTIQTQPLLFLVEDDVSTHKILSLEKLGTISH